MQKIDEADSIGPLHAAVGNSRSRGDRHENVFIGALRRTRHECAGSGRTNAAEFIDGVVNRALNGDQPVGGDVIESLRGIQLLARSRLRIGQLAREGIVAIPVECHRSEKAGGASDGAGGLIQVGQKNLAHEIGALHGAVSAGIEVL